MEDNLIQLPLPDEARKPVEAFRNGLELGARIRKVFWLAEQSWWNDFAPLGDGLSDDTFRRRLSTEIASVIHWMGKQSSFRQEDVKLLQQVLSSCATAMQEFFDPPRPAPTPSSIAALAPEDDEFADSYVPREAKPREMARPAASQQRSPDPRAERLRVLQLISDDPEIAAEAAAGFSAKSPFLRQAFSSKLPTTIERCCRGTPLQWDGYQCGFICGSACEPFCYLPREAAIGESKLPMTVLLVETIDALFAMSPDERLKKLRRKLPSDAPADWAYFEEIGDAAREIVSSMLKDGVQSVVRTYALRLRLIERTGTVMRKNIDGSTTLNDDHFALLKEIASAKNAVLPYDGLSHRFSTMRTQGGSPDSQLNGYVKWINERLKPLKLKIRRGDRSFHLCEITSASAKRRPRKPKGNTKRSKRKRRQP